MHVRVTSSFVPGMQRPLADVYLIDENGWLAAFMKSIIDAGGSSLSCGDTNKIFFTPYCNFMAPIYNGLASEDNPDFIVMSQYLNGDAKGFVSLHLVSSSSARIGLTHFHCRY